jgi:3-dehydroquinate dehydratase
MKVDIIAVAVPVAVTHHSAIVYNALSNPKVRIISMHLMHLLILESHRIQSPLPIEQPVC